MLLLNNLSSDKILSEKLGENGKNYAGIFSWENIAKAEIKICKTLIAQKEGRIF